MLPSASRFMPVLFVFALSLTSAYAGPQPPGACCLMDATCEPAVEDPPGTFCCNGACQSEPFPGACLGIESCFLNEQCLTLDAYCCAEAGGTTYVGNDCNDNLVHDACELQSNDCNSNEIPDDCESPEACCLETQDCLYVPTDCCTQFGGHPVGKGSVCQDLNGNDLNCGIAWACCRPGQPDLTFPFCENWTFHFCIEVAGGIPLGPINACKHLPDDDMDDVGDPCDNCPGIPNPQQGDCNDNGVGDACEPIAANDDDDGDGTCNGADACPQDPNKVDPGLCGCGATELDADGDSVPDCVDQCPGENDLLDDNGNDVPDCLDPGAIPTVSEWGLIIMTLLLAVMGKFGFRRERARPLP